MWKCPHRPGRLAAAALAAAALAAPAARGELITPGSIPAPPAVSPAAQGAAVAPGGVVTDQYQAAGVVFPLRPVTADFGYATALAPINGVVSWTGAYQLRTAGAVVGVPTFVSFDALSGITGDLTRPNAAGMLRLELTTTGPATFYVGTLGAHGDVLRTTFLHRNAAGSFWVDASASGARGFYAAAFQADPPPPHIDGAPAAALAVPAAVPWGVSAIDPGGADHAPEPAALLLGGLGAGAFVVARRRRRGVLA